MLEGFAVRVLDDAGKRGAQAFVLATWLRNYEATGRALGRPRLSRQHYFSTYHPAVSRLARTATVALASATEDPDTYAGWACGSAGVLHYVFVRGDCRGMGIGRELVRAACGSEPRIYTFTPSKGPLLELAASKGMKYHPHPIPGVQEQERHDGQRDHAGAVQDRDRPGLRPGDERTERAPEQQS